jgi:SAM-dependent methyltransferase
MQTNSEFFTTGAENFYLTDTINDDRFATPGSQYILRLIKGRYLEDYSQVKGLKVLDVGCGSGFDLVTIHRLGWEPYGCEISEKIVQHALERTAKFGFNPTIKVGDNQNLPYPDNFFDMLWSNNVMHYLDSEQAVEEALAEYSRVLKPGGRVLFQTTHPRNWLLKDAKPLGGSLMRVNYPSDFRHDEIFYVFQDEDQLHRLFAPHFKDLKTGLNVVELFAKCLRNWVLTGVKS